MEGWLSHLSHPTRYPSNKSYRPHIEKLIKQKQMREEEKSSSSSLAITSLVPSVDKVCRTFLLKDGGLLKIINHEQEVLYHLQLLDGRQIKLERTPQSLALHVIDTSGNPIKTLACEL